MAKENDTYEDHKVTEVKDYGDQWAIGTELGFLHVSKEYGVEPRTGDTARFYGKGMGYSVRGVDINGVELYYQTKAQHEAKQQLESDQRDSEKKAEADANKTEADALLASLPDCFQKRIARFRRNNPDFYWEHEGYEMSSCVDAVKIANEVGSSKGVEEFSKMGWDEQMKAVPGLSDGRSGNTFGMAIRLAHGYLSDERLVFANHAAISALVGCDKAGCPPVTPDEMIEAGYEAFEPA